MEGSHDSRSRKLSNTILLSDRQSAEFVALEFWLLSAENRKRPVVLKAGFKGLSGVCVFRLCRTTDGHDGPDQGAEPQPGHPLPGVQAVCHPHVLPQGGKPSSSPI